jgi:ADP-ribose pyrophosphatase YjhB (NUDIX family)
MDVGASKIPEPLYKQIYESVPIFCVDVIAVDGRKQYLLIKRKNKPLQGQWAFPGGRVLKNEPVHEAAIRKLEEETGLMGSFIRQIGFYEYIEREGYFEGMTAHIPIVVCLVNIEGPTDVVPDRSQVLEHKWCQKIEPQLHEHLKDMLRRAGFEE